MGGLYGDVPVMSGDVGGLYGDVVPGRAGPGSGHGLQRPPGREVVASYTQSAKLTKCSAEVVKRHGKWAPVLT